MEKEDLEAEVKALREKVQAQDKEIATLKLQVADLKLQNFKWPENPPDSML